MEFAGKYAPDMAPRIETAPMVDAEVVLFAGRSAVDIGLPVAAGVLCLVLLRSFVLAALVPPVLFVVQPWLKRRFGRGRVLHQLWVLGLVVPGRLPAIFSVRDGLVEFGP